MAVGQLQSNEAADVRKSQSVVDAAMCIVFEERMEVPLTAGSFVGFRCWSASDRFPERGRIDYLAGRIEVDMSPESVISHGALKMELGTIMNMRIRRGRRGRLFTDRTRVVCPSVELSVEPDLVFFSRAALTGGKITLVPYATPEEGEFLEIEGAPDLVVEIVSKTSVGKDTVRLPALYWAAGVREFWLADARKNELSFQIHKRGQTGFERTTADNDGFQWSEVLECAYRIERIRDEDGQWTFTLVEREKLK